MCYIEMCFRVTMLGQYQINKQTNKQTASLRAKNGVFFSFANKKVW
jgi:hypothetical protein